MKQEKIILITGATGAEGGSVAKALLAQQEFKVRVLTRNAGSEKALALQQAGAEVVQGDLEDTESLYSVMKGCYGVFGTTNFRQPFGKGYEEGKNLIDAVGRSGIKHFVLHTLPDYSKLGHGKYPVPHCDIKAALQQYTKGLGLPATFVQPAFYYENFFTVFPLQQVTEGTYSFGFPQGDTKLAMVSVEDTGGVVSSIFGHPAEYIGRTVGVVGADDTCSNYAALMTKVLDQKIYYSYVPRDTYAAYAFPNAEAIANMFEVQRLHILSRQLDLIESYGLNPAMQSFEKWLIKNKGKF